MLWPGQTLTRYYEIADMWRELEPFDRACLRITTVPERSSNGEPHRRSYCETVDLQPEHWN